METQPPPTTASTAVAPPPKKGLGTGAKIGIGCGVIVLIAIIGIVIGSVILAGKAKKFADNPPRAAAEVMISASFGAFEMVAQDDVAKRYTVKEKKSGTLTTIYWDEKTKTAKTISGDFSAIPADTTSPP